jgi:hypothetical protein
MFEPQRVLISRAGDPRHEPWQRVPGLMVSEPSVGQPMQMFLESGKIMRTSPVIQVEHDGPNWVVATRNSQYRLTPAS